MDYSYTDDDGEEIEIEVEFNCYAGTADTRVEPGDDPELEIITDISDIPEDQIPALEQACWDHASAEAENSLAEAADHARAIARDNQF